VAVQPCGADPCLVAELAEVFVTARILGTCAA